MEQASKKGENTAHSDVNLLTPGGEGLQISEKWGTQDKSRGLRNLIWLEMGKRTHGEMTDRHHTALESINLLSKNEINVRHIQFGLVQMWLMSTGSRDELRQREDPGTLARGRGTKQSSVKCKSRCHTASESVSRGRETWCLMSKDKTKVSQNFQERRGPEHGEKEICWVTWGTQ